MAGGEAVFFRDFSKGVVAHIAPTKLTDVASPRAWNTAFMAAEGGTLGVSARPGYREIGYLNDDDDTVIAHTFFEYTEANTTTRHHVAVRSDGTLWQISGGVATQITIPTGAGEFGSSTLSGVSAGVVFVQASNRLFGFVRGGVGFKIFRRPANSTLYVGTIGLPVPNAPAFDSEVAGDTTGTIDFRVAWYNSATGTEGPMSDPYTRAVTSKAVTITLPTNAPSEVDKIRVYVRKQSLSTKYTRDATMEYAAGTTTFVLDADDDTFNSMTLTGEPSEGAWSPHVAGSICAAWHLSRMFVSDGFRINYSASTNPEQWDPASEEAVSEGSGQLIMALRSIREGEQALLGIWKERSIHGMAGSTPATWNFDELVADVGTISTRSLAVGDGLYGFWSERGPTVWAPGSQPKVLTDEILKGLLNEGSILLARRDQCHAAFDPQGRRFLWTLDRTDTSRFTVIPWSTLHKCWESLGWDLGPITCMTTGYSAASESRIMFGAPKGTIYELSRTLRRDAATEGSLLSWTTIVTGSPTGGTVTTGGPTVNARNPVAHLIDAATMRVHHGTYTLVGTALTWTVPPVWTPDPGSILLFDGPVAEWDTVDTVLGAPHQEKRILQTYGEVWTVGDVPIFLGLYRNTEEVPARLWSTRIAKNAKDRTRQGPVLTGTVRTHKRWGGMLAQWARMRLIGWYPNCEWSLVHLGFEVLGHDDED